MRIFYSLTLLYILHQPVLGQNLYVEGGWLFSGLGKYVVQNPGITIQTGKIVGFGPNQLTGDFELLSLSTEDYVLPGIVDLHAHYRVQAGGIVKDDTVAMPAIFLANGVTTTFPAGEIEPEKMRDLRIEIDKGNRVGPRILNSGSYFGSAAPDWNDSFTVQDVYERVDKGVAMGVKGFKAKNIKAELLEALIERAHQHGLTVTAHLNSGVNNSVNPQDAVLMGIDRIEHFLGGDLISDTTAAYNSLARLNPNDHRLDEVIQLFINRKVYFDATLFTYGAIAQLDSDAYTYWEDERSFLTPYFQNSLGTPPRGAFGDLSEKLFKVNMGVIKRYYDAGGLISLGTDRPFLDGTFLGMYLGGFGDHREMQLMSEAGIPNAEVIKIATINGARAIGMSDRIGTVEVGKWGDLMIIKGNPLRSIKNTRTVHTVVKGGKVYSTAELLNGVRGKLGPRSAEDWRE